MISQWQAYNIIATTNFYIRMEGAALEGKASLEDRYISLRSQFHTFQLKCTFSNQQSPDNISNLIKCYQFLNQLECLFTANHVANLFQFVRSIFTVGFGLIKEIVGQGYERKKDNERTKLDNERSKLLQSQLSIKGSQSSFLNTCDKQTQTDFQQRQISFDMVKGRRKRNCLSVDIMDINTQSTKKHHVPQEGAQKLHANVQQIRTLLQSKHQQTSAKGDFSSFSSTVEEYRPIMTEIFNFSGVDQTIKTAIDKFKDSEQKTREFLNIYEHMKVRESKCKMFAQLFGKDSKNKIAGWMWKWKEYKDKCKAKLSLCKQVHCAVTIGIPMYNHRYPYVQSQLQVNQCIWAVSPPSVPTSKLLNSQPKQQYSYLNSLPTKGHTRNMSTASLYGGIPDDQLLKIKTNASYDVGEHLSPSQTSLSTLGVPPPARRTFRNSAFSNDYGLGLGLSKKAELKMIPATPSSFNTNHKGKTQTVALQKQLRQSQLTQLGSPVAQSLQTSTVYKPKKSILIKEKKNKNHLFKRSMEGLRSDQ